MEKLQLDALHGDCLPLAERVSSRQTRYHFLAPAQTQAIFHSLTQSSLAKDEFETACSFGFL